MLLMQEAESKMSARGKQRVQEGLSTACYCCGIWQIAHEAHTCKYCRLWPLGLWNLPWGCLRRSGSFPSHVTQWLVLAPVVKLLHSQNDAELGQPHSLALPENRGCTLKVTVPHHCSICWETKGVVSWYTQSPACPHMRGRWAQGHGTEAGIPQLFLKEVISCKSFAKDTFHYALPLPL